MKKLINSIALLLSCSSAFCQSPVYPIFNNGQNLPDDDSNVYFKDINNDLDKYEGIWIWEENGNKLTVALEKKVQHYLFDEYYEDIIVGNYKYEENGVVIIDTMTNPLPDPDIISGTNYIQVWGYNQSPGIMHLIGRCDDPIRSHYADFELYLQYISPNLVPIGSSQSLEAEKLKWTIIATGFSRSSLDQVIDTSRPFMPRVPNNVVLVKQ